MAQNGARWCLWRPASNNISKRYPSCRHHCESGLETRPDHYIIQGCRHTRRLESSFLETPRRDLVIVFLILILFTNVSNLQPGNTGIHCVVTFFQGRMDSELARLQLPRCNFHGLEYCPHKRVPISSISSYSFSPWTRHGLTWVPSFRLFIRTHFSVWWENLEPQ
jgi:hypothetical protein